MSSLQPKAYDAIIVGAGSIGLPTALALAQAGMKVLVLEKNSGPAQGCQKWAIGGVRATHSDMAKMRLCLRSLEVFSSWQETYGHDIEWYRGGYCFVAYRPGDEATLKNVVQTQQAAGLNIKWLDRRELLDFVPSLNEEELLGGSYSPEDGYCSSLLAGFAYYDAAHKAGVDFVFQESIQSVLMDGDRVRGVKTEKGEYTTPILINAAGAYARQVGQLMGLEHAVKPDMHEAGVTEPLEHFLEPMLIDVRPGKLSANFYYYQHNTGQIIFCITPQPNIWGDDTREAPEFLPIMAERMIKLTPCLRNVTVRRTWRGLYPMTPDGSPFLGWSKEIQGYFMAIGMCGQGFMLGPGIGELITRVLTQSAVNDQDAQILDQLSPYRAFKGQEALK